MKVKKIVAMLLGVGISSTTFSSTRPELHALSEEKICQDPDMLKSENTCQADMEDTCQTDMEDTCQTDMEAEKGAGCKDSGNDSNISAGSYPHMVKVYCEKNPKKCILLAVSSAFILTVSVLKIGEYRENQTVSWIKDQMGRIKGADERTQFLADYFGKDVNKYFVLQAEALAELSEDPSIVKSPSADQLYTKLLSKRLPRSISRKIYLLQLAEH